MINNVDRDHSNDPFIVKKAETAEAFLHKNGFPDHLKKIASALLAPNIGIQNKAQLNLTNAQLVCFHQEILKLFLLY